jgi:hypothetical protein
MTAGPIALALHLAAVFERLGVPYLVGGSVASSILGEPRATEDVDLVADLQPHHVDALVAALEGEFYVDRTAIARALGRRSSFNLIHLATARKVDIFVQQHDAFGDIEMSRRFPVVVSQEPASTLLLATAEDLILQKLNWYRKTGGRSDRQWRDVLGILKVQAGRLDVAYLRQWARALNLDVLLERALSESTV